LPSKFDAQSIHKLLKYFRKKKNKIKFGQLLDVLRCFPISWQMRLTVTDESLVQESAQKLVALVTTFQRLETGLDHAVRRSEAGVTARVAVAISVGRHSQ
jgi:hypothetical protein